MMKLFALLISGFLPCHHMSGITEKDTLTYNSMIVSSEYTSNTSSFGRFSALAKQPSFSGYASFYSKKGFNIGLSGLAIANSDSTATKFSYEYDFNAGYDLSLGKLFSLSASYSHFFYSKNSFTLNSVYKNEFVLGLNFSKNKFFANVNGYYLSGSYNEWMNSFLAGFNFEIDNAFYKGNSFTISPELSIVMSDQEYYNQYAYQTYWYLYFHSQRNPGLTVQDIYNSPERYPVLWRNLRKWPKVYTTFKELDRDLVISSLFEARSKYNVSSVNFTLPVYYNIGNLSVTFTYSLSVPLNLPDYFDQTPVNYYSAGIVYTFIW